MSDFQQRIASVKSELDGLIRSVDQVQNKVQKAADTFERLSENADDISTVATALGQLNRLLSNEKSPLLDKLRSQIGLIQAEIEKLNDRQLQKVTKSFESQAEAFSKVASASTRISNSIAKTSQGLAALSTSLQDLKNSGGETTLESISKTLNSINNLTNVKSVVQSLNGINSGKINEATAALRELRVALTELNKVSQVTINADVAAGNAKRSTRRAKTENAVNEAVTSTENRPDISSNTSRADQAETAAQKLERRSAGITRVNLAIEAIEQAQIKVLQRLVEDAGETDKFDLAKRALITRLSKKDRNAAVDEFLSASPNAARIANKYENELKRTNISTGLDIKEFESVNLGDQELISGLYRVRKNVQKQIEELDKASKTGEASASLLSNIQSFSTNVYRPLTYGITEFGAFMNGIMSVLKGIKVGGITGYIDALGGAFKSIHAFTNASAYFGLGGGLPGSIGKIFNRTRSDSILDFAEVFLKLQPGNRRNQDAQRVRELSYEESHKSNQLVSLRKIYAGLDESEVSARARLKEEIDEVAADLRKLRQTIRGYNAVMQDAAEKDKIPEPMTSTGAQLAKASSLGEFKQEAVRNATSRLDAILKQVEFLDLDKFARRVEKLKLNIGANPEYVAGVAEIGQKGGILVNKNFDAFTQQSTAYHESTHRLVDSFDRYALDINKPQFKDQGFEKLRQQALARANKGITLKENPTEFFSANAEALANQKPDYFLSAQEMYANVSQAFLTGNKKFETALREIYGTKLFDKIIADLKAIDPGTYLNPAQYIERAQQAAKTPLDNVLDKLRGILGPIYDTISKSIAFYVEKVKEYLSGNQKNPQAAAASILVTSAPDQYTGIQRTFKTPDIQPDLITQLVTKYEKEINAAIDIITGAGKLQGGTSGLFSKENIGEFIGKTTELLGFNTQPLTQALGFGGISNLGPMIVKALVDPATADFKALGASARNINIARTLETFLKEQFNLRKYTGSEFLQRAKNLDAPFAGLVLRPFLGSAVTDIANTFDPNAPGVSKGSIRRGNFYRGILQRGLIDQLTTRNVDFEEELNEEIRSRTGRNIRRGSYNQQATYDPITGMTKFIVSAQTADGALVSLNAKVDEFGRKKITDPAEELDYVAQRFRRFVNDIPNQLIQQTTYSIVNGIQQMVANLVSVQDELSEVANLYGVIGDKAEVVKQAFLESSVGTAISTGQGFQEAIATNLKNFKLLGAVQNPNVRQDLSNQLSEVQLGAQTAFGISLEQSLESIPSILSDIQTRMGDIDDPVKRVTLSIQELRSVMDQIIVAQRATGASGDELLTVYSRLAASAREYGLSSKDLLALTSVSSVSIGKGSEETTNVLKSFLEGTYSQANESQLLKDFGIKTRQINQQSGRIENRPFSEVLRDIYAFTQNPETSGQTAQLLQVFAGPKPAADIGKVVKGFGADYARARGELDQPGVSGSFSELVTNKLDNYQGSINKLNAAGTELFSSFLVGAGVIDKLTNFIEKLSQAASALSGFLKDNKEAFRLLVNVITPNIIDKMTSGFIGAVNIFGPFVKLLGAGQTTLRGLFAQLVGFDKVVKPIDKVSLTLRGAIQALEIMEKTSKQASASVVANMEKTAVATKGAAASMLQGAEIQASASVVGTGAVGAANSKVLGQAKKLLTEIETSYNAETPNVAGNARLSPGARKVLGTVGDAAGSLVAPLAFDILAGGMRTDNVAVNTGAAIGGAFVGAVTANPALGVFFYSIIGEVLDRIDVGKFFHLSDREADAFASAIARRIRKNLNAQTEEDVQVQNEEERQNERKQRATTIARSSTGELEKVLGIDRFRQLYQESLGGQRVATRGGAVTVTRGTAGESSFDLERYIRLVVKQEQPGSLMDKYFLSSFNTGARQNTARLYDVLGNDQLRQIYKESNISDVSKFLGIFSDLSQGQGSLLNRKDIQDALITFSERGVGPNGQPTTAGATNGVLVTESSADLIKRLESSVSQVTDSFNQLKSIPYGLDKYSPFGTRRQQLEEQFAPKLDLIRSGALKGDKAQAVLDQYEKAQQALDSIPQSLQVLIPLAQALGLAMDGLEEKLYKIGPEGQQKLVQRFQPAVEAVGFNQQYEARSRNLQILRGSDQFRSKDPEVLKEVDALNKALTADRARYEINKAYLDTIKGQTGILLDQANLLDRQAQTRKLISAGTPAQFTPANIFDTKGLSADKLNEAINYAVQKQNRLAALNPEYRKEFAKDQFLLESGTTFKGVQGVNQGFVQEFLSQQQQKANAPLEDLSKYSDQEISQILERAQSLQGQAEKLDPTRVGKYENERILILRKNNEILQKTGLGQEFLRLALEQNTKSNESLRGHYNLPAGYKPPTIWDYYNEGGRETGNVNYPNGAANGMVPLAFAQQLAKEIIAGNASEKGADLSKVVNTIQPGSRPLFYPTPGTPAVYSEEPPSLPADYSPIIPKGPGALASRARYEDFKLRQVEAQMNRLDRVSTGPVTDQFDRIGFNRTVTSPAELSPQLQQKLRELNLRYRAQNTAVSTADGFGTGTHSGVTWGAEAGKNIEALARSVDTAKEPLNSFGTPLRASADAAKTFATKLPTATQALNSGIAAITGGALSIMQKFQQFDPAQAFKQSKLTFNVYINGQAVPADKAQVTIVNTGASTGTSALAAGSPSIGNSKLGAR